MPSKKIISDIAYYILLNHLKKTVLIFSRKKLVSTHFFIFIFFLFSNPSYCTVILGKEAQLLKDTYNDFENEVLLKCAREREHINKTTEIECITATSCMRRVASKVTKSCQHIQQTLSEQWNDTDCEKEKLTHLRKSLEHTLFEVKHLQYRKTQSSDNELKRLLHFTRVILTSICDHFNPTSNDLIRNKLSQNGLWVLYRLDSDWVKNEQRNLAEALLYPEGHTILDLELDSGGFVRTDQRPLFQQIQELDQNNALGLSAFSLFLSHSTPPDNEKTKKKQDLEIEYLNKLVNIIYELISPPIHEDSTAMEEDVVNQGLKVIDRYCFYGVTEFMHALSETGNGQSVKPCTVPCPTLNFLTTPSCKKFCMECSVYDPEIRAHPSHQLHLDPLIRFLLMNHLDIHQNKITAEPSSHLKTQNLTRKKIKDLEKEVQNIWGHLKRTTEDLAKIRALFSLCDLDIAYQHIREHEQRKSIYAEPLHCNYLDTVQNFNEFMEFIGLALLINIINKISTAMNRGESKDKYREYYGNPKLREAQQIISITRQQLPFLMKTFSQHSGNTRNNGDISFRTFSNTLLDIGVLVVDPYTAPHVEQFTTPWEQADCSYQQQINTHDKYSATSLHESLNQIKENLRAAYKSTKTSPDELKKFKEAIIEKKIPDLKRATNWLGACLLLHKDIAPLDSTRLSRYDFTKVKESGAVAWTSRNLARCGEYYKTSCTCCQPASPVEIEKWSSDTIRKFLNTRPQSQTKNYLDPAKMARSGVTGFGTEAIPSNPRDAFSELEDFQVLSELHAITIRSIILDSENVHPNIKKQFEKIYDKLKKIQSDNFQRSSGRKSNRYKCEYLKPSKVAMMLMEQHPDTAQWEKANELIIQLAKFSPCQYLRTDFFPDIPWEQLESGRTKYKKAAFAFTELIKTENFNYFLQVYPRYIKKLREVLGTPWARHTLYHTDSHIGFIMDAMCLPDIDLPELNDPIEQLSGQSTVVLLKQSEDMDKEQKWLNTLFDDWLNANTGHSTRIFAGSRKVTPFGDTDTNETMKVLKEPEKHIERLQDLIYETCNTFRNRPNAQQQLEAIAQWLTSNSSKWLQPPFLRHLPEIYRWFEHKIEKLSNYATGALFSLIMGSTIKMQLDDADQDKFLKTAIQALNRASELGQNPLNLPVADDANKNIHTLIRHFEKVKEETSDQMKIAESVFMKAFADIPEETRNQLFVTPSGASLKFKSPGTNGGIYVFNLVNSILVSFQAIGLIGKGGDPLIERALQQQFAKTVPWLYGELPCSFIEDDIFPVLCQLHEYEEQATSDINNGIGRKCLNCFSRFSSHMTCSTCPTLTGSNLYQPLNYKDRCSNCLATLSRLPDIINDSCIDGCVNCTRKASLMARSSNNRCCKKTCLPFCRNCHNNCEEIRDNACLRASCNLVNFPWWISKALCAHCIKIFPQTPHSMKQAEIDALKSPLAKLAFLMNKQMWYDTEKGIIDAVPFSNGTIKFGLYILASDPFYATSPKAEFLDSERAKIYRKAYHDAIRSLDLSNGQHLDPYHIKAFQYLYGSKAAALLQGVETKDRDEPSCSFHCNWKSKLTCSCQDNKCCPQAKCTLPNKSSSRAHCACFTCLEATSCCGFATNIQHFITKPFSNMLSKTKQSFGKWLSQCCNFSSSSPFTMNKLDSLDLSEKLKTKLEISLSKDPNPLTDNLVSNHLLNIERKAQNNVIPFSKECCGHPLGSQLFCGWNTNICGAGCQQMCKAGCTKACLTGCMKAADNYSLPEGATTLARDMGYRMDSAVLHDEALAGTIKDAGTGAVYRGTIVTNNKPAQAFFSGGDLLDTNMKEDYVSLAIARSVDANHPAIYEFSRHQVGLATQESWLHILQSPKSEPLDFIKLTEEYLLKRVGRIEQLGIDKLEVITEALNNELTRLGTEFLNQTEPNMTAQSRSFSRAEQQSSLESTREEAEVCFKPDNRNEQPMVVIVQPTISFTESSLPPAAPPHLLTQVKKDLALATDNFIRPHSTTNGYKSDTSPVEHSITDSTQDDLDLLDLRNQQKLAYETLKDSNLNRNQKIATLLDISLQIDENEKRLFLPFLLQEPIVQWLRYPQPQLQHQKVE